MAVSTNKKSTIYRNLFENMGPGLHLYSLGFEAADLSLLTNTEDDSYNDDEDHQTYKTERDDPWYGIYDPDGVSGLHQDRIIGVKGFCEQVVVRIS